MEDKKKTYRITVECNNCGVSNTVNIPFGTPINEYKLLGKETCISCGCRDLHYIGKGHRELKNPFWVNNNDIVLCKFNNQP